MMKSISNNSNISIIIMYIIVLILLAICQYSSTALHIQPILKLSTKINNINNKDIISSLSLSLSSSSSLSLSSSSSYQYNKRKNIIKLNSLSIPIEGDKNKKNIDFKSILNPLLSSQSNPVRLGPHVKIKGKVLTIWGVLYALSAFSIAILVLPFMMTLAAICDMRGNGTKRKVLDWIIHYWAKIAMLLTNTRPKLYGAENLPSNDEVVMYIPNHTSFMDILVLSGFVPRAFKYLSKEEIKSIPVIGTAMGLAKHVFLKRDDLKSTFEVTETTVQRLKDGNSMVLFAEGTRSPDGALKTFKKGAFQMAKAAGVKIVPVSIGNLHRWMPKDALLPLAPIRHVYIKIHPPINTDDKTVSQLRSLTFAAVNDGLPIYQQGEQKTPKGE